MNSWLPLMTAPWTWKSTTGSRSSIPKAKATMTSLPRKRCSIQTERGTFLLYLRRTDSTRYWTPMTKPNSIALEMLDRIKAGDLKARKHCYDWLREDLHLNGGDDSAGWATFPHFWTQGQAAECAQDEAGPPRPSSSEPKPTVAQGVALLEEAQKDASAIPIAKKPISSWRWPTGNALQAKTTPNCWKPLRSCSSRFRSPARLHLQCAGTDGAGPA